MAEDRKPFWARCVNEACRHAWAVAYLPMEVETMANLAKAARCPMCGSRKPVVAKQEDGKLLEEAA